MKTRKKDPVRRLFRSAGIPVMAALLLVSEVALGQDVIAPGPGDPQEIQTARELAEEEEAVELVGEPAQQPVTERLASWMDWGPVQLRPFASYQFLYGSGIIGGRGSREESTAIHTLAPGLRAQIYRQFSVSYNPSFRFFSNDAFEDVVNHHFRFQAGQPFTWRKWSVSLSQTVDLTEDPSVETGTQTERNRYTTSLTALYEYSSKTQFEVDARQQIEAREDFADSREWSILNWMDYQLFPKLHTGAGVGFGFVDQDRTTDMTYEQLRVRGRYQATAKVSVEANGGVEFRQFLDSDRSDAVNPVFGLGVTYLPLNATEITVSGDRSVRTSSFTGQMRETTSLEARIRQRFFQTYFATLSGGYEFTEFEGTDRGIRPDREDDRYFIRLGVERSVFDRGSVGVFYQFSENSSTDEDFSFESHQTGFQVSYRF